MRFDDTRTEWRINDVERKAEEASRRFYELDTLRSNVDSLERTVRELSTTCDGLRYELEELREKTKGIKQ